MYKNFAKSISIVMIVVCSALMLGISGCGEKTVLTQIPGVWAENSLITSDGRLFVSGGINIYEITQNEDGTFQPYKLYNKFNTFMGLAQRGEYLYAIIGGAAKCLMIANLNELTLSANENAQNNVFTVIPLSNFNMPEFGDKTFRMPNGMCIDANGYIYITDESAGRIMRFHISNDDPTSVEAPEVWIDEGADAPNGIAVNGDIIYFTEVWKGELKKVTIQEDGSPGDIAIIHTRPHFSILDDIAVFGDGVLITSCGEGKVIYISDPGPDGGTGEVLFETLPQTFSIATSVSIGQSPMFEEGDIIVTEGGGGHVCMINPGLTPYSAD